jgi:hypothetical protein
MTYKAKYTMKRNTAKADTWAVQLLKESQIVAKKQQTKIDSKSKN